MEYVREKVLSRQGNGNHRSCEPMERLLENIRVWRFIRTYDHRNTDIPIFF